MHDAAIQIALAFLEGFALIISPCILPILPIILAGSLHGGKRKPLGIIIGFILAFAVFTFFARSLLQLLGFESTIIRNASLGILLLLGIIMISDYLTSLFEKATVRLSSRVSSIPYLQDTEDKGGFFNGFAFGALIGIIWTPCAGPILAAVIVQTVIQKTSFYSFLTVLSFGIGVAVPMLLIVFLGRQVMSKFSIFKSHAILLRKILGGILMIAVGYIIYSNGFAFSPTSTNTTASTTEKQNIPTHHLEDGLKRPYAAPDIAGIEAWINSKPLQLDQLKGKVVLIDFWTYSCINCVRSLPYIKDWYAKYHKEGLVVIGVHTPEFDFEKNLENVKNSVSKYGIEYPVALDNNFVTWRNFKNQFWPAHYLINKEGEVVYTHFGEGDYDITENNIRFLLGMNKALPELPEKEVETQNQTPETYLGYARVERFSSPDSMELNQSKTYHFPPELREHDWALQGDWIVKEQQITAASPNAAIKIHFNAEKVYAVMGNKNKPITVKVLLNGEQVISQKGSDVKNSSVIVNNQGLYSLIDLKRSESGVLELIATEPDLEVFTFTFGK